MKKNLQLSDAEWELMKVLWEVAPASVNTIAENTHKTARWHPKTVRTMLLRLLKKQIVEQCIVDGVQHFQPRYSREECASFATESFIQRVFDGAVTPMVAYFTEKRGLTDAEKAVLKKLLSDTDNQSTE